MLYENNSPSHRKSHFPYVLFLHVSQYNTMYAKDVVIFSLRTIKGVDVQSISPCHCPVFVLTSLQLPCYARSVLIREQYSVYLLIVRKRKQSMSCSMAIVTKLVRKRSFRTQGAGCDSACTVALGRTMPFFRS